MTIMARWRGDEIKGIVRRAAVAGLREGVELAKERSISLAPIETGELKAKAYTDVDENTLIGIVGYDLPRDIKTIKQHEDLSYHHPRGGQAKFLEEPVKQSGSEAQAKLAARMRAAFG